MRTTILTSVTAALLSATFMTAATAGSVYDGAWSLDFMTQRGDCDPSYHFDVNVNDGFVSHPNLVRFRGKVTGRGVVHASVTVQDKFASGSGRLNARTGQGTWSGYAGNARCSGYWTAQRQS